MLGLATMMTCPPSMAGGKATVSPCRVGYILTSEERFGAGSLRIGFNRDS